ncbi:hypothetical protein RND71_035391 [Anisodus tanguticus]|uniref:Uncharacterized protein n=1 Tax=Anisodus tanguticus TaxID=243964 RepID=A0AAE1R4F3_9SOLA|nr:hypothetical protein RND71_035391 [Anisodus tanguticus]
MPSTFLDQTINVKSVNLEKTPALYNLIVSPAGTICFAGVSLILRLPLAFHVNPLRRVLRPDLFKNQQDLTEYLHADDLSNVERSKQQLKTTISKEEKIAKTARSMQNRGTQRRINRVLDLEEKEGGHLIADNETDL